MRKGNRDVSLDLLRIVSMCMIIVLHEINKGLNIQRLVSVSDVVNQYMVALTMCSVNLFVLISAYFLVEDNKINFGKVLKIIIELWLVNFIVSVGLFIFGVASFSKEDLIYTVFPFFSRRNWFINVYLVLYVLHPYINRAIYGLSNKAYKSLCIILFMFFSVLPSIMPNKNWTYDVLHGYSVSWFICLYIFMGYYKRHLDWKKIVRYKALLLYFVLGLIMIASQLLIEFIGKVVGSDTIVSLHNMLFYYDSVPVLLMAFIVFHIFRGISINNSRIRTGISILGSSSLGVYIIHDNYKLREVLWSNIINIKTIGTHWFAIIVYILIGVSIYIVCSILFRLIDKLINIVFEKILSKMVSIEVS